MFLLFYSIYFCLYKKNGVDPAVFAEICNIATTSESPRPSALVVSPAGGPGIGTSALLAAVEALRCAQCSASPVTPLALVSSRMLFVPPMLRLRPLCRHATCTSVQSIVWLVGVR